MKSFRVQLLIALLVVICGISLMGLIYLVFSKPDVVVNPGVVVSTPSPVSIPVSPMRSNGRMYRSVTHSHTAFYSNAVQPSTPIIPMQPIGSVWESKNARIQVIGGGAEYRTEQTNNSAQQRGIQQTAVMPMTTFTAMASVRQVAAPTAAEAPAMAKLASGPHRAPGPPTIPDLEEKDQLVEHTPVGEPLVLALMAGLYAIVRKRKEDAE